MGKQRKIKDLQRSFGARVRALRRARAWSQLELGERAGLDHTYVGGVERGERNLSLEAIGKLAAGLGVPPADLFRTGAAGEPLVDARLLEVLGMLEGADEATVERVVGVVRVMVRS